MNKYANILLCNLATLGSIGYLRPAPGTIGSLVALVTGYLIAKLKQLLRNRLLLAQEL